jgi:hypothetical protein
MSEALEAADVVRERIALRIIAAAKLGERDPARLLAAALRKPARPIYACQGRTSAPMLPCLRPALLDSILMGAGMNHSGLAPLNNSSIQDAENFLLVSFKETLDLEH